MSKIILGDCLEELRKLETDSVDFVCTDPPYGYSFMGKHWDKAVPSIEIWQECLRVLKPGGFMNVMSAPRSDVLSRMIVRIEDAGFRVDFTPIYWTYASGFPKAGNIGKLVDKRLGVEREVVGQGQKGRNLTRNGRKGDMAIQDVHQEPIAPIMTKGNSELEGSYAGFQPKPAVEVIIVAMKPLSEKTFVDQALKNGKGISWLDDCRVPTEIAEQELIKNRSGQGAGTVYGGGKSWKDMPTSEMPQGRFPANLLVSDDVLNDGTSKIKNGKPYSYAGNTYEVDGFVPNNKPQAPSNFNDSGSYSRYFDLDKWASTLPFLIVPKASKSEKNKGLEHKEATERKTWNGSEGHKGIGDYKPDGTPRANTKHQNHHPTVKPLKLMSYLITLFSREGDTILDPFVGSGTTCLAAKNLKRKYIGIEREAEYVEIANARLTEKQEVLL